MSIITVVQGLLLVRLFATGELFDVFFRFRDNGRLHNSLEIFLLFFFAAQNEDHTSYNKTIMSKR